MSWPRDWNFNAIIVGLPGDGKTTIVRKFIRRHLAETPGIVLAHDPLGQYLSDGCVRYADANAYRRAAAEAARTTRPMPRGASIGGEDGDAVTSLALEMGTRLNRAKLVHVPILVPFDEAIEREGSGSTYASKLDKRFLTQRRHRGVGGIFNLQDATLLTALFYLVSTDVILFRLPSYRALDLDVKLGLEKGTLVAAGVTRLGPHEFLRVRPRLGVVSDPL